MLFEWVLMVSQEELDTLFSQLRALLKKYEGILKPKKDEIGLYDLWSFKDLEIAGRKRKELFFASVVTRKNYVGFYYMPIYTDTGLSEVFKPELLSLLKGKSCFHIKLLTPDLENQVKEALEFGYKLYQDRGWV